MDAEDTKERIRQLRQRVVSDPSSIVAGQDFSALTEERLKAVKSWKSVTNGENPNKLPSNDAAGSFSANTAGDIKEEFENRYQKNLQNKDNRVLIEPGSQIGNQKLLEAVDLRIMNNSKEFIKFLEEKFQKLRKDIVSNESFDEYKEQLHESLSKDGSELTEKLKGKIKDVEIAFSKRSSDLAEQFSNELTNVTEKVQKDAGKAFEQASILQTILPDKMAEVENKIFSDLSEKLSIMKSEILSLRDSVSIRSGVMESELGKHINQLENKVNLETKENQEARESVETSLNEKIDSSLATVQADMVENLLNIEGEVTSLRESFSLKSEAVASELSSKVNAVDKKIVSSISTLEANLDNKLDNFDRELGDIRDSFGLRSEAMLSELGLQIDDLKGLVDSTTQNGQKESEAIRYHLDEQISSTVATVQVSIDEKCNNLNAEVQNLRDLLALRSEAISSEFSVQVDDLRGLVNLNFNKGKREAEAFRSSLEEKIKLGEIAFQDSVDQQLQNFEGELVESKGSIEKKIEKVSSDLDLNIERFEKKVRSNGLKYEEEIQNFKSALEEKINSVSDSIGETLKKKLQKIEVEMIASIGSVNKKIEVISSDLCGQIKDIEERMSLHSEANHKESEALKSLLDLTKESVQSQQEGVQSQLEKLDLQFKKLEQDLADNLKVLRVDLSESERRALGAAKEKYRTLKSIVWEQLELLRNDGIKFGKDLKKIEKKMISSDSLRGVMKTENTLVKDHVKKELARFSSLLKVLEAKILSEDELTELFQNYSLNVNIARNKAILSKVKRDFEHESNFGKFFREKKLSKVLAITVLLGSILVYVKTLT